MRASSAVAVMSSAPLAPRGEGVSSWCPLLPFPPPPPLALLLRSREGERLEGGEKTLGREDAASAWRWCVKGKRWGGRGEREEAGRSDPPVLRCAGGVIRGCRSPRSSGNSTTTKTSPGYRKRMDSEMFQAVPHSIQTLVLQVEEGDEQLSHLVYISQDGTKDTREYRVRSECSAWTNAARAFLFLLSHHDIEGSTRGRPVRRGRTHGG